MIYLAAILGLVFGFFFGQLMLSSMLRDKSRADIMAMMKDPGQRLKYGLINWGVAALWSYVFVCLYKFYF